MKFKKAWSSKKARSSKKAWCFITWFCLNFNILFHILKTSFWASLLTVSPINLWAKKYCKNFILLLVFLSIFFVFRPKSENEKSKKETKRTFQFLLQFFNFLFFQYMATHFFVRYVIWHGAERQSKKKLLKTNKTQQFNATKMFRSRAFWQFISLPFFFRFCCVQFDIFICTRNEATENSFTWCNIIAFFVSFRRVSHKNVIYLSLLHHCIVQRQAKDSKVLSKSKYNDISFSFFGGIFRQRWNLKICDLIFHPGEDFFYCHLKSKTLCLWYLTHFLRMKQ